MTVQSMTLQVPDALYLRLKERAEQTNRSVEAEALDVLAGAIPVADQLPADLENALSPLATLHDAELERAARSRLPDETVAALEELHLKQQREGLGETERQTLDGLVRQYERNMLVRAQAAALLQQRGHTGMAFG
jgi:plasmid stability protein